MARSPRARKPRRAADSARGERDLAGAGPSQLGPTLAMRARELNRPTDEDLAEAEATLTLVRRERPPDETPRPRRRRS